MKKHILLLLLVSFAGCGGDIMNSLSDNIIRLTVSDALAEAGSDTATVRFTTNIPSYDRIEYGLVSGTYTQKTDLSAAESMSHSVSLTGLASNTTYYARAVCSVGGQDDVAGKEFAFSTYSTITISNLAVSAVTLTGARLDWTTNLATTHLVEYGTVSGSYTASTLQSSSDSTVHSVTLSGLTSSTTYYYRVKNYHSAYGNITSVEYTFSTSAETAPTAAQRKRGIWLIGGLKDQSITTASNTVGAVDLFDPDTQTWYSTVTTLPTPVSFAAAVGYEGKIYVMGGFDNSGTVTGLTQVYDIDGNSWSSGMNMSNARANHSAVVLDGKIYVTRGTTGSSSAGWVVSGGTNSLIYTISANTWTSTGVIDSAVSNKTSVAVGGVVYYLGGRNATTTVYNAVDGIIVSSNSITALGETALTSNRAGSSAVAYTEPNGAVDILVLGGFTALSDAYCYAFQGSPTATATNLVQYLRYPFSGTGVAWANASSDGTMPTVKGFGAAVISGSTLYWFGGTNGGSSPTAFDVVYSYNMGAFPSGTWTDQTSAMRMPHSRFGHNAVIAY